MFVLGFWEIKSGSKGENQMTSWNLYFLNFNFGQISNLYIFHNDNWNPSIRYNLYILLKWFMFLWCVNNFLGLFVYIDRAVLYVLNWLVQV